MKNNNLTEIVFILDRSGSMSKLEEDTIGGYNSLIEKQKREQGEAVITTVLFDDMYELIHDHADIKKIAPLNHRQYYARGCTALNDAIGKTINHVGNRHKYAPDNEIPGKTMFVITTDGVENASREFSADKVREMINHQKEKYDWEFLFLGANMDAVKTAAGFGIGITCSVTYRADSQGTRRNFDAVSMAATSIRHNKPLESDWKKDVEEYEKEKRQSK